MKYRLAVLILCLELIVAMPVFTEAQTPAPGQSKTPAAAPEEPLPVLGVPPGYKYEAQGRRDPFINPVPKPLPSANPATKPPAPVRPPGLKGATVEEVTLNGVFVSKSEPSMSRAVLLVPGLRAPIIASRGDVLFDAVVKEIRPDSVVFTKVPPADKSGNPSEAGEVTKKLRSTAGDKK